MSPFRIQPKGDRPKRRHAPFWYVAVLVVAILDVSPFWRVAVLNVSPFWLSLFWSVAVLICRRFDLSPFWICRRFGLSPFWFVAVLVCRRFGLSPFWSIAVLLCSRFGFDAVLVVAVSAVAVFDLYPSRTLHSWNNIYQVAGSCEAFYGVPLQRLFYFIVNRQYNYCLKFISFTKIER